MWAKACDRESEVDERWLANLSILPSQRRCPSIIIGLLSRSVARPSAHGITPAMDDLTGEDCRRDAPAVRAGDTQHETASRAPVHRPGLRSNRHPIRTRSRNFVS